MTEQFQEYDFACDDRMDELFEIFRSQTSPEVRLICYFFAIGLVEKLRTEPFDEYFDEVSREEVAKILYHSKQVRETLTTFLRRLYSRGEISLADAIRACNSFPHSFDFLGEFSRDFTKRFADNHLGMLRYSTESLSQLKFVYYLATLYLMTTKVKFDEMDLMEIPEFLSNVEHERQETESYQHEHFLLKEIEFAKRLVKLSNELANAKISFNELLLGREKIDELWNELVDGVPVFGFT